MTIDIVNEKLCQVATEEKLLEMGFIRIDDGSDNPFGVSFDYKTDGFLLTLDCVRVVRLYRKNPDSDEIVLFVETLADLQAVMDWMQ